METIKRKPFLFGLYWLFIFLFLFGFAFSIGLISIEEDEMIDEEEVENLSLNQIKPEEPLRVIVDKIGINSPILRPQSRNISVLDEALKDGSVKYPGSGLAGGQNNMLLFGHSSSLPVVINQNYKAFNNLDDLILGDKIRVQGESMEFIYEVIRVDEADAEDFRVDFNTSRRLLTLSTCNNFGDLDDRFIVQAELVGTRPLRGSL